MTSYAGEARRAGDETVYQGQYEGQTGSTRAAAQEERDPSDVSLGQLIGEISTDLSALVRQELELAKSEMREEALKAGKGAGMLGAAGVAGLLVLVFGSLALMFALDAVMSTAWAALIVTVMWAVLGFVAFRYGRAKLKSVNPVPERAVQTMKEDVRWAKHPTT